jgi:hypothetical protein
MKAVIPVSADDRTLYQPPAVPVLVRVPAFTFVMVDHIGDPAMSPDYRAAIAAVYAVSYPVVMALRQAGQRELKVRPLEGLWWAGDPGAFNPARQDRASWRLTMMIRQPDNVPAEVYYAAFAKMAAKTSTEVAARVRVEHFDEGLCAQLTHYGPYAVESTSIVRLHGFAAARGLRPRGRHHEIYLSDPRRGAPGKMRTVLRQPVGDS